MGDLGTKKEDMVPKRRGLRKEKGNGKQKIIILAEEKDLEVGSLDPGDQSCVQMNAGMPMELGQ